MIGSTYLAGPAIPITGVAASYFFFAHWVGTNFVRGLFNNSDILEKFPSNPY